MKVAVVKYNAGNIRSVDYALRRLGVEAEITADEKVLRAADKVISVLMEFKNTLCGFSAVKLLDI